MKKMRDNFQEYLSYVIVVTFFVAILAGFFLFADWLGADEAGFYMMGIVLGVFMTIWYKHAHEK